MMTKEEMLMFLKEKRSGEWNEFRKKNPDWAPNLAGKDLTQMDFVPAWRPPFDLSRANLCGSKMPTLADRYSFEDRHVILDGAIYDATTEWCPGIDVSTFGARFLTSVELKHHSKIETQSVFISYAWANEDVILALDQWLRSKNLKTRMDRRDFFAGTRIRDEITRVMQECDVILVFYSEKSKDKPWTEFEREFASDLEMEAKRTGRTPPKIIYVVLDETPLPSASERSRLAVVAKGKRFELVCEELYHQILQLERTPARIDLEKWKEFVF